MTPKDLNDGPQPQGGRVGAGSGHRWTFLSNHAHVLVTLAQDPAILIREIAARTGITERAVTNIL